jgi:hypothetical protein
VRSRRRRDLQQILSGGHKKGGREEINGEAFSETPPACRKKAALCKTGFFSLSLFLCSFNWFDMMINLIFMMH